MSGRFEVDLTAEATPRHLPSEFKSVTQFLPNPKEVFHEGGRTHSQDRDPRQERQRSSVPRTSSRTPGLLSKVVEIAKGRFDGIGDANPENVNSFIVPHLIRMAETRAKARALRDAVNIGVVWFEELAGEAVEEQWARDERVRRDLQRPRPRVVNTPVAPESVKDTGNVTGVRDERPRSR